MSVRCCVCNVLCVVLWCVLWVLYVCCVCVLSGSCVGCVLRMLYMNILRILYRLRVIGMGSKIIIYMFVNPPP